MYLSFRTLIGNCASVGGNIGQPERRLYRKRDNRCQYIKKGARINSPEINAENHDVMAVVDS